jgi:trimethylamine--corrinoid protein Co-methyltransferase
MDRHFHGLKMISTKKMTDEQAAFLSGKVDWLDGTTLMTCLRPMATMVEPFLRSVRAGNQLLFLDLTISGASGPGTPESLLTMIHAQELFMIVVAQTVNPGVTCVHGGIPGIMDSSGDLSYSALSQPLINAAMARLNRWVTGLPSAQSGGSSSLAEDVLTAAEESEASRATMRKYGVHIVRHSLGAMGNLNFFSLEKFKEDCRREREARYGRTSEVEPALWSLYFPEDDQAMEAIRELGEKGNPRSTDHTLRNVGVFDRWVEDLTEHDHQRGLVPDEALVAA